MESPLDVSDQTVLSKKRRTWYVNWNSVAQILKGNVSDTADVWSVTARLCAALSF